MSKLEEKPCLWQFPIQRTYSVHSEKTYFNTFENATSHGKFNEEFEDSIKIELRVKTLPENC